MFNEYKTRMTYYSDGNLNKSRTIRAWTKYYAHFYAKLLVYKIKGVTIEIIENIFRESDRAFEQ